MRLKNSFLPHSVPDFLRCLGKADISRVTSSLSGFLQWSITRTFSSAEAAPVDQKVLSHFKPFWFLLLLQIWSGFWFVCLLFKPITIVCCTNYIDRHSHLKYFGASKMVQWYKCLLLILLDLGSISRTTLWKDQLLKDVH